MKDINILFFSAVLSVSAALAQQAPSLQQPQSTAQASSDAQIEALQEQIKALQLQQIAALQKQQQAITQPKPALPPCEAPAPPKKASWLDRAKARAEQRLGQIAENGAASVGGKIDKATKGQVKTGDITGTVQDGVASASARKQDKPCVPIASAVPANAQGK